ncbi:hypothetical protein Q427_05300 [Halomonas sp. BC04]|nr:hypothetical protein Q427_05300 [Halomonas sp. BC04]
MAANTLTENVPDTMAAMLLTGHGDIDKLVYREDVATPKPGPGEVLVRVTATAKNNTDRKAREGLYPTKDKGEVTSFAMGGEPTLTFPRIQGPTWPAGWRPWAKGWIPSASASGGCWTSTSTPMPDATST